MKLELKLYNLKSKIRDFILPEVSYEIGIREKIAARISPEPHYTITIQENGSYKTELVCQTIDEKDELIPGCFYQGNAPKKGEILRLDVFIPGITSGMNYGIHPLPVKEVKEISKNLKEVIVDAKDINWK
jgi:hypothetical protein